MGIERIEVSSDIWAYPGSIREPLGPTFRPRSTSDMDWDRYDETTYDNGPFQEDTMSETETTTGFIGYYDWTQFIEPQFKIEPTDYEHTTRPRLVLTDLAHCQPLAARSFWLNTPLWQVARYGGFKTNPNDLPALAIACYDYTQREYRNISFHYAWKHLADWLQQWLYLNHTTTSASDRTEIFGSRVICGNTDNTAGVRFFDKTWLDHADNPVDPDFDILSELGFDTSNAVAATDVPLTEHFARGMITRGSSGYHEIVIITANGPRAFMVPESVDYYESLEEAAES